MLHYVYSIWYCDLQWTVFPAVNKSKNDAEAQAKQKENAISRQAGITYKTVALQDEWQRSQEAAERCTFQQTGCPRATCWLSSPAEYHGRSSTQSPRLESGREDGGEPGREADSEISPGNGKNVGRLNTEDTNS